MKRHLAAGITLFIAWALFLLFMGSAGPAERRVDFVSMGGWLVFIYVFFARSLRAYRRNEDSFWLAACLMVLFYLEARIAEQFVLHQSMLSARTGGRILFGLAVFDVVFGFYLVTPKKAVEGAARAAPPPDLK